MLILINRYLTHGKLRPKIHKVPNSTMTYTVNGDNRKIIYNTKAEAFMMFSTLIGVVMAVVLVSLIFGRQF